MEDIEHLQVLLLINHKEQDRDSAPVEEGSAGAPPPAPLHRSKIILYALLPRISRYDVLTQLFDQNGVIVLTSIEKLPADLLEGARTGRVDLVELVIRIGDKLVDSAGRLIVSTDPYNSNILPVLLARHKVHRTATLSEEEFQKSSSSHFYRTLDDETNFNILKTLLAAGPDIRHRHQNGGTLLHFAVRKKYLKMVALLVASNVEVDAKTRDGKTPLRLAIDMPVLPDAIIISLLEGGADVNLADEQGTTPFLEALRTLRLSRMDVIVKLLDKGGDVNAEAQFGSALKLATEASPFCLSEILKRKPDLSRNLQTFREIFKRAAKGDLPLSCVPKLVVRMLWNYGFKLPKADANDIELLDAALRLGIRDIFEEFLRWGAVVHRPPSNPTSSAEPPERDIMKDLILRAITRGDVESVEYLLKIDDVRDCLFYSEILSEATRLLQVGCIKTILQMGDLSLSYTFNTQMFKNLEVRRGRGSNELKTQIRRTICRHITMCAIADLRVNERFFLNGFQFRKDALPDWVLASVSMEFLEDCILEVERLKGEQAGDPANNYYNILNATVPETVRLLRNATIRSRYTLRSRRDHARYPNYWPFIDARFQKAEYRRQKIDEGVRMLPCLSKNFKTLPSEILEHIVQHLCNHELMMLIDVCTLAKSAIGSSSQGTA